MFSFNKSGAALITVLVAVTLVSIMLFEFQYESMVERKLAYNDLNQLQAYYLAKSGMRLGLLRLNIYGRAKRQSKQLKTSIPNIEYYLDSIWNLPLPSFPPSRTTIQKMDKPDKDAAEKLLQETQIEDGNFTHVITSESSKINVNYLAQIPPTMRGQRFNFDQPQGLYQYVGRLLVNVLDNLIKASDNPYEEYGNLKPEEVVFDIMDWITPGSDRFLGGNKDSFYEQQNPPYRAKRALLYSVDELRMVRGIDDHLFNKLKPYVTVYSQDGKININTCTGDVFRAIFPDFTEDDIKRILEERGRIGGWNTEAEFVKYVKENLNRPAFATFYSKDTEWPFTVSSKSFLVESAGVLQKSQTNIQKTLRAAVAFSRAKAGSRDITLADEARCNQAPGRIWAKQNYNYCMVKPLSQMECESIAGQWDTQADKNGCCTVINTIFPPESCIKQKDATSISDSDSLKILQWTET